MAASSIIFLLAPTSASPGWGSGSAGPFGPSSNLQPRKRGLRPAVTEGDKRREGVSPTRPEDTPKESAGPYPEPSIGRIRATKENDATRKNENSECTL